MWEIKVTVQTKEAALLLDAGWELAGIGVQNLPPIRHPMDPNQIGFQFNTVFVFKKFDKDKKPDTKTEIANG